MWRGGNGMLVVKLLLHLHNGTPPPIDMLKYKYGGGNSTRSRLEILLEKMIMFECKGYNERQCNDEHFECKLRKVFDFFRMY